MFKSQIQNVQISNTKCSNHAAKEVIVFVLHKKQEKYTFEIAATKNNPKQFLSVWD